jgi:hypothetical protein
MSILPNTFTKSEFFKHAEWYEKHRKFRGTRKELAEILERIWKDNFVWTDNSQTKKRAK